MFLTRVWSIVVPERVRAFIWLPVIQVVMTNVERKRRHLSDTDLYSVYKQGEETIIHILRDCPAMRGIWSRTVHMRKRQAFFSQSLLEWVFSNLGDGAVADGSPWSTDRVGFLKDYAKEVIIAQTSMSLQNMQVVREDRLIKWVSPREGWCFPWEPGSCNSEWCSARRAWELAWRFCFKHRYMFGSIGGVMGCILQTIHSLGDADYKIGVRS
ncbi:putative reverse transcriptase zinc-binding domain-containing protein [Arabidopsis thaliana]